jgi:soluble lytic murein transglycosylase
MRYRSTPLLILLGVAVLIGACGDGSPDPTPSPAVSPVPSSVPIDLGLAARLHVEGDTEGAVRLYSAAVLRGTEEEKQRGLWALSRIQYEGGEEGKAVQNLEAFLATEPEEEEERRAHLLLGFANMAQGRPQDAKESFETYIRHSGPATPYAQAQLAEIAAIGGDYAEAARGAEAALASELPPAAQTDALFALARYQEEMEDLPAAIATARRAAEEGEYRVERVDALWLLSRLLEQAGDEEARQQAMHRIITAYPETDRALEALDVSERATATERAHVLFTQRRNADATETYQLVATDADPVVQAEAHHRLGILAERAGTPDAALVEYTASLDVLNVLPAGSPGRDQVYGNSLWDKATVLENLGRLDEAVDHYAAISQLSATLGHATEGLFRAGMIRYRQGRPGDASGLWQRYTEIATAAHEVARANFWLARAYADMGDTASQQLHLQSSVDAAPAGYYGLRARALLDATLPTPDPAALELTPVDWSAVEAALTAASGPEGTPAPDSFFLSPKWLRAEELLDAGLTSQARDEVGDILDEGGLSSWESYRLSRLLAEHGEVQLAARAVPAVPGAADGPTASMTLTYPAKYLTAVNEAAQAEGVSPLLLLALVRQESWFDAGAVSIAGALGLTQVIPGTGENIATDLGLTDFRETDLLEPQTSLRFGAHYLASQLDGFGGNESAALSAYNGGPGNAARWTEVAGNDRDLFLETIDFDETRLYVRVVLENYAHYRYTYGVTEELSLPFG